MRSGRCSGSGDSPALAFALTIEIDFGSMPRQRSVFVSCGQLTEPEKALGREVARVVEAHGMTPFFAQDVHSAGDLNSEVFRAIQTCDAFLAILQKRGTITFGSHSPAVRSSVWIQQEIAIFCYRMFLEQRSLPLRVYSERGIRREGVMEIAVVNPIEFDREDEVVTGVNSWLNGHEFEEHPIQGRREDLFRHRFAQTNEDQLIVLELVAAYCLEPVDFVVRSVLTADFYAIVDPTGAIGHSQVNKRFLDAYTKLSSLGLIRVDGNNLMEPTGLAKQWWPLIHNELRNRGRRA